MEKNSNCKCHTIIISNIASVNCIENSQIITGKADVTVHEAITFSSLKSFSRTYYINGLKCYYWQVIGNCNRDLINKPPC